MSVKVTPPKEREVTIVTTETIADIIGKLIAYSTFSSEVPHLKDLMDDLAEAELTSRYSVAVKPSGGYNVYNHETDW